MEIVREPGLSKIYGFCSAGRRVLTQRLKHAMNKPQIIFDEAGRPAFAVVPWRQYESLAGEDAEALLSDEELYDLVEATKEESLPLAVVKRLVAGENPVKVYQPSPPHDSKRPGVSGKYQSDAPFTDRNGEAQRLHQDASRSRRSTQCDRK